MSMVKEFKEFALKGNVMDLAVGVIIGGAFSTIVNSIVKDLIMPVVYSLVITRTPSTHSGSWAKVRPGP